MHKLLLLLDSNIYRTKRNVGSDILYDEKIIVTTMELIQTSKVIIIIQLIILDASKV